MIQSLKKLLTVWLVLLALSNPSFAQKVSHVIDGDTLKLSDGRKIRLLLVDTPESALNSKLYRDARKEKIPINKIIEKGLDSKEFTRKLVEGKNVTLKYDKSRTDLHGRTLAYVYTDDGMFLNEELIRTCHARPMYVWPNDKFRKRFEELYKNCQ